MAAPTSVSYSPFAFFEEGIPTEEITGRKIQELVLQVFKEICEDARVRLEQAQKCHEVIEQGFWYTTNYIRLLSYHKLTQKHEQLKKEGSLYHGKPPEGFTMDRAKVEPDFIIQMTDKKMFRYVQDDSISADRALKNLLPKSKKTFFFIDCQMAIEIAYYAALRSLFGKRVFNAYFSKSNPLILDCNFYNTPLKEFLIRIKKGPYLLGDSCYFKNNLLYQVKHPDEEAGGWHAICTKEADKIEDLEFAALGFPNDRTKQHKVVELFVQAFNKPAIPLTSFLPKELARERRVLMMSSFDPKEVGQIHKVLLEVDDLVTFAKETDSSILQKKRYRLSKEVIAKIKSSLL